MKYRAYRKPSRKIRYGKSRPRSFGGSKERHALYIVGCLLAVYEDFPKAIIAVEIAQLRVQEKIDKRKAKGVIDRQTGNKLFTGVKEVLRLAHRALRELMKGEARYKTEATFFFVAAWNVIQDRKSFNKSNPVACSPKERAKAKREAEELKRILRSEAERILRMRAERGLPTNTWP